MDSADKVKRLQSDLIELANNEIPPEFSGHPQVVQKINDMSCEYIENFRSDFENLNPYNKFFSKLAEFERHAKNGAQNARILNDLWNEYSQFASSEEIPLNTDFWERHIKQINLVNHFRQPGHNVGSNRRLSGNIHTLYNRILDSWRKDINSASWNWELSEIQKIKTAFMESIDDWFYYLEQITELIDDLDMECGDFLDFSVGNSSFQDVELLKRWLREIDNIKGIREICEQLGRIKRMGLSGETRQVEVQENPIRWTPNCSSKEEIVGIKVSNEIENMVPSELSLLSLPETSTLFDIKFVESQLMCFDMIGYQKSEESVSSTREETVEDEEPKGPIILCIDTSGSMCGLPETVAKAFTLHIANLARKDQRSCYVINFSVNMEFLDFSPNMAFSTLIKFLGTSFHEGTDPLPALEHALVKLENGTYSYADLVILSDFEIGNHLPKDLAEMIKSQRDSGNKFHALCISGITIPSEISKILDRKWLYDTSTRSVSEITVNTKAA